MSAPDTPQPTKRAAAFMAANAVSRATDGFFQADGGMKYVLEDGTIYELSREDCRSIVDSTVRWLHG